jgi:hypothetical protein
MRRFVVTGVLGQSTTQNGNRYITCTVDGDEGRLAIWGKPGKDTAHIDMFNERVKAGFPVTVEREWIRPTDRFWEDEHGHCYWAYERYVFPIVE